MHIRIAERLRPFSHHPGTKVILPLSKIVLELYPTLFIVGDQKIPLELTGPVKEFTVQLDLEKGCVWVWGFYQEGYRRFCLWSESGAFKMAAVRGGETVDHPKFSTSAFERLSLGSHKKQDWCLVKRRGDLKEIVPHWLRLAQLLPSVERHDQGVLDYLRQIPKEKTTLNENILNLYHLGFDGIFHPRLDDRDHLGVFLPSVSGSPSPLALIAQGAEFLRSLFIEEGEQIKILPCLPPQFHCGRLIFIDLREIGTLHIEWSKKMIRRMIFNSASDRDQTFVFQKEVKNFRFRKADEKKGKIISSGSSLSFSSGSVYYFDRFEK